MTVLTLLVAGDTVYVFEEGDPRIDMQYLVCVGANLDVERFTATEAKWAQAQATLDDDAEVVDCRNTVPESGGYRTEYHHQRYGWVSCDVTAETAAGFTVDLGRAQPWAGMVYGVKYGEEPGCIRRVV